ncbi:glycerate kinase type-2 family protein [Kordiimonas aquimaris]|uniref:glycerate kinase type-2 family protein n=1 Tax=Kordiimonas aquimaris TaxID=707591 RepID=UPI0021D278C9|nr:DUF4147 domain-containing protein [Kordiimonas aquimaris]
MIAGHDDKSLLKQSELSWPFFCEKLFDAAIAAVLPDKCLPKYLPDPKDYDAVKVIAFGKAAADMAAIVEQQWVGVNLTGVVICPYGKTKHSNVFDIVEASHPLPDKNSIKAADCALRIAEQTGPHDLLLILASGGGSALMAKPAHGLSLDDKRQVIKGLLHAGATIDEVNHIRRSISAIKGGKLLSAAKSAKHVVTLAISDVVNDDPSIIASGPSVPCHNANQVSIQDLFEKYPAILPKSLEVSAPVDSKRVPQNSFKVIANAAKALSAAEAMLEQSGCDIVNLGYNVEGEARDIAARHADQIVSHYKNNQKGMKPIAFLSGGELTVTVQGNGMGGPNQEYVLAMMQSLPQGEYYVFAADTDGLDGIGGAAGAFITPETYSAARNAELNTKDHLINNDSFNFFNKLKCNFKVKNKAINVNDLRVVIWLSQSMR